MIDTPKDSIPDIRIELKYTIKEPHPIKYQSRGKILRNSLRSTKLKTQTTTQCKGNNQTVLKCKSIG